VRTYTARYERAEGGWVVQVAELDVVAFGRTLEKARFAIAEALSKRLSTYRGNVVITDDIDLPKPTTRALTAAREARARALEAAALSQSATRKAAERLVEAGLSYRDAAYLLGLSHSRIQQLVEDGEADT
jgi:predicted RNase H-like HicB family nuclease